MNELHFYILVWFWHELWERFKTNMKDTALRAADALHLQHLESISAPNRIRTRTLSCSHSVKEILQIDLYQYNSLFLVFVSILHWHCVVLVSMSEWVRGGRTADKVRTNRNWHQVKTQSEQPADLGHTRTHADKQTKHNHLMFSCCHFDAFHNHNGCTCILKFSCFHVRLEVRAAWRHI